MVACGVKRIVWLTLWLLLQLPQLECFAVVGYVADYRFPALDWEGVVSHTSHIVLFSLELTAEGGLTGLERLSVLKQTGGGLVKALRRAGQKSPKILVAIGGPGRSANFSAATSSAKARRKTARHVVQLLTSYPIVAGIDLYWETPQGASQWRDLGKLAREIRTSMEQHRTKESLPDEYYLSMTFRPNSGAVSTFSSLHSKASGKSFVELFDLCHGMAYAQYDQDKRHSTQKLAKLTADEWLAAGLPFNRLSLGLPFFGVSKESGAAASYAEIVEAEPSLLDHPDVDETKGGLYFNNANTLTKKVRFAIRKGLGGVMIWEVGQDTPPSSPSRGSLLRYVWSAAMGNSQNNADNSSASFLAKIWSAIYARLTITEDGVFLALACSLGTYFMFNVVFRQPVRCTWERPEAPPETQDSPDATPKEEDSGPSENQKQ